MTHRDYKHVEDGLKIIKQARAQMGDHAFYYALATHFDVPGAQEKAMQVLDLNLPPAERGNLFDLPKDPRAEVSLKIEKARSIAGVWADRSREFKEIEEALHDINGILGVDHFINDEVVFKDDVERQRKSVEPPKPIFKPLAWRGHPDDSWSAATPWGMVWVKSGFGWSQWDSNGFECLTDDDAKEAHEEAYHRRLAMWLS